MADNPLQDNTNAQENATEATREQLRATEKLTDALDKFQAKMEQEKRRYRASQEAEANAPPPISPQEIERRRRWWEARAAFESQQRAQQAPAASRPAMAQRLGGLGETVKPPPPSLNPEEALRRALMSRAGQAIAAPAPPPGSPSSLAGRLGVLPPPPPKPTREERREDRNRRRIGELAERHQAAETKRLGAQLRKQREQAERRQRRRGEMGAVAEAGETVKAGDWLRRQREQQAKAEADRRREGEQDAVREAERAARLGAQMRKQREQQAAAEAKEQDRLKREGPLADLIAEHSKRQEQLRNYYKSGGSPDDLAARALRARVAEQEGHIGRRFASLDERGQARTAPLMQNLEDRRRQIEEEEIRRRKQNTEELKKGTGVVSSFTTTYGIVGQAVGQAMGVADRLAHFAALSNPALGATYQSSKQLLFQEAGRHTQEATRGNAEFFQRISNLSREHVGKDITNDIIAGIGSPVSLNALLRKFDKSSFKEDQFLPVHSRITSGEEYESQLANAAIESGSQQASMELLRRQLEQANMYLRTMASRSNDASAPAFGD